ncbi:OmpA family protein [Desulfofustis glycolicus]|uniref:Outer membrane protein OmpA n=1 Tax=Desulfofustis glycolicus DSM 9705 TaxID=1121409 RepID=A0A1M5YPJ2_9BACT|nr:Outer membrane protein OmpA [Desulfofustis glycolicus DSM 9705]
MKTIESLSGRGPEMQDGAVRKTVIRFLGRTLAVVLATATLFVLSGCGDVRYTDTTRKFQVDQDDRATAKYILRQGNRALTPVPERQQPATSAMPAPPPPLVLDANNILFDFDKAVIKTEFLPELDEWAGYFKTNPAARAQITGHADSTGPETYNQGLSERRAQAVVDYLVKKGIDPARLTSVGYGETMPVAPNDNRENRQKNRRVELNY